MTLFVGGADDAVGASRPVLSAYGDPILHVGPHRRRASWSSWSTTRCSPRRSGSQRGRQLGARLGVDEGPLLAALTHGSSQSRVLSMIAAAGFDRRLRSAVGEFVGKDIAVVRDTVAELGGDLGLLDALVDAGTRA